MSFQIVKIIIENRQTFENPEFQTMFEDNARLLLKSKGIYFPSVVLNSSEKAFYFSYESPSGYKLTLNEIWNYQPSLWEQWFSTPETQGIIYDTMQQGSSDTISDVTVVSGVSVSVLVIFAIVYLMIIKG